MLKTVQLINTSAFGNGTVTQVQGNGTVNGITLTGNVTSSGNITLGGTLGSIANSQLSNSSVTIGNTTISLGGTATSLGNIALANVSTTGLTGYLYGNDGTGNVTASTTIPNTGLANSTITLGNATLTLGSTTTAVGNLTLNNVTITSGTENNVTYTNATISSVKTTFPNTFLTNNSVTIGNTSVSLGSTVTSFGNVTLTNATISSLSTPITTTEGGTGLTSFTTNGVVYASSTSALATGSALTFDGTKFTLTASTTGVLAEFKNSSTNAQNGNIQATNDAGTALRIQVFGSAAGSYGMLSAGSPALYTGASELNFVADNASGAIKFGLSGATERARIDSSGNLLIGYTSSNGAYKLQVNSQIFATSSTIATSDANYKENVIPLTNALDLVKVLNPVQFSWKQHPVHNFDTTTPTVGFIAQEVQATLSQMSFVDSVVKQSEVTLPDGTKEQFLGIAEGNMIAILTAALKELNAKFDAYVASH